MEALLPQVTAPFLAEIDVPGVVPLSLSQCRSQPVFLIGHHNQMQVIEFY
jgi:hypothetical protein